MRKSRFSQEQIIGFLREQDAGGTTADPVETRDIRRSSL